MTLLLAGWRRLRRLPRWTRVGVPLLCAVLLALPAAWPERADDPPQLTRVTGPAVPDPSEPDAPDEPVEVAAATSGQPTTTAAPGTTAPSAPATTVPPGVLIGPMPPDRLAAASLSTFPGCEELLGYLKHEATKAVEPWGIPWGHSNAIEYEALAMTVGGDGAPAEHSETNVQEDGVDEPDMVEVDGRYLFALEHQNLRVVEARGGAPRVVAKVWLGEGVWSHELLLSGDHLVVLSGTQGPPLTAPESARSTPITRVRLFDVSQAASPRLVSTVDVNGERVDARAADGLVRLVVRSGAMGLPFVAPDDDSEEAKQRALAHNRQVIADSSPSNWLLMARTWRDDGNETTPAVSCDDVHRPDEFAGLDTVSVVTLDMASGRLRDGAVSVLADGHTVYANRERLYVGSSAWGEAEMASTTSLHQFALDPGGPATYVASGRVRGSVAGQFSLSEHGGRLRVASTEFRPDASESFVTILETRGGALVPVGQIGGLGRGEQIYAVRFMGEVGYVVTFRQVDPLYVLDLSDPTAPAVRGELKILGYSAYLHPVGDGLLLGVGQDATEDGITQGLQVSLFDVSDPARPTRLDQRELGDRPTHSEVEYDHHAFLWWRPTGLAVVPYWSWDEQGSTSGVTGITVADRRLAEAGRLTHAGRPGVNEDWEAQIRRSVVSGGSLYTVSEAGVLASDVSTLAERGWAPFD